MTAAVPDEGTLGRILRDAMTSCEDGPAFIRPDGDRPLSEVWTVAHSWGLRWWFNFFEKRPEERARYRRIQNAAAGAFRDCARLQRAMTGETSQVPPALLELIRQRLAVAYFGNPHDVGARAEWGPGATASEEMNKLIDPALWCEDEAPGVRSHDG